MTTTIVKWGNSRGIRLPKHLLDSVKLTDNDIVEVITENNNIIIKKLTEKKPRKTFEERIAGFNGEYISEEWDTGKPVGNEVW